MNERTKAVIIERFIAGETLLALADDYNATVEYISDIFRDACRDSQRLEWLLSQDDVTITRQAIDVAMEANNETE